MWEFLAPCPVVATPCPRHRFVKKPPFKPFGLSGCIYSTFSMYFCKLMYQAPDILMMAYKQPVMQDQLVVLQEKDRQIPVSVQYSIKRYQKNPHWKLDDICIMV